ncbi:MAG: hypothetical protein IJO22_00850 [Oscillospiraceae bacterium]|nr:hypothetical protein [Oscillospiraceae bacterium]
MKKLCFVLVFALIFCSCGKEPQIEDFQKGLEQNFSKEYSEINSEDDEDMSYINGWTPDFKPSDFETYEEYEKAFLDEFVKHLEPSEYFETEKEYPAVILEIFNLIMEEETVEFLKCEELRKIEVSGDENEFFVSYLYLGKKGSTEGLNVRIRKIEDGKYGLLGRGGGPLGYGLESTELTLEDIL